MHVFRPRTDLARVLLALVPLIGAALIAISRCEDYRHDVYDVITGSLLGLLVAHFTYRRYYPQLRSSRCDTPFPHLVETSTAGSTKLRDEEARIRSAGFSGVGDLEDNGESIPLRERSKDRDRGRTIPGSN